MLVLAVGADKFHTASAIRPVGLRGGIATGRPLLARHHPRRTVRVVLGLGPGKGWQPMRIEIKYCGQ
jgi:hypothetical protein